MPDLRHFGNTSNIVRFRLRKADTGQGLTGLSSASSGLIISTAADNEATATTYTVAGSTIETITTLGTFATPTATKCRFKEFDATNHPGLYEFQFADARFAVSSSKRLVITVTGATNLLDEAYEIELVQFDPFDAVRMGMTALPNAAAEASGGLYTRGTGAGQIKQTNNGEIDSNVTHINNIAATAVTTVKAVIGLTTADTIATYTGNTPQTGDAYARLGAPAGASVSADVAAVKTDSAAVKVQTDKLTFTVANQIDANVLDWKSATAPAMTGDAYARLGAPAGVSVSADVAAIPAAVWDRNVAALSTVSSVGKLVVDDLPHVLSLETTVGTPAGASVSADIAAAKTDTAAIKVQTDKLTFTVANQVDSNAKSWAGGTIPAPNVTGVPLTDLKYTLGTISPATAGSVRADAVTGAVGSVTGAVGSVTGNVGGNVTGSVGSISGITFPSNFSALLIDSSGRITNRIFEKNTAVTNLMFVMTDSTNHAPLTGLTPVVTRSIDGGVFGSSTNTPATEVSNGWYKITLSAADMNGDIIAVRITETGADDLNFVIETQ